LGVGASGNISLPAPEILPKPRHGRGRPFIIDGGLQGRARPRGRLPARRLAPAGPRDYTPAAMLKHNSYFEGQVQSVGYERLGRRMTVGVMAPGEYHFGTDAPERMTVVSGELGARFADGEWRSFPAGTSFEVPGKSGFDVRAAQPSAYLCEFL
jgi:uncharacterized protein YaiE (UPF0345 family)